MKLSVCFFIFIGFGLSTQATTMDTMYNSMDSCKPWSATKTAKFLVKIENSGSHFKFVNDSGVIQLINKKSLMPYARFYETKRLCLTKKN